MQEPLILLVRRKGPLQQHVAVMMRSPDRGSERSLRLAIMWNFI